MTASARVAARNVFGFEFRLAQVSDGLHHGQPLQLKESQPYPRQTRLRIPPRASQSAGNRIRSNRDALSTLPSVAPSLRSPPRPTASARPQAAAPTRNQKLLEQLNMPSAAVPHPDLRLLGRRHHRHRLCHLGLFRRAIPLRHHSIGDRGRYRVACQAMDLTSLDLADGADVLTAVKDKARCRARVCGPP